MLRALEEGTPWAIKAELYIKLLKEAVRKDMREANSPLCFWDYCIEQRARIYNLTARDNLKIRGTNPHTATLSEEGDISNLCQYKWYDWCYFREHTAKFPHNQEVLGCVLGPVRGDGNEMAQWILKASGSVVPRRSLRPLHHAEVHSSSELNKCKAFDALIERRHGTAISPPKPVEESDDKTFDQYKDEDEAMRPIPDMEDAVDANGTLLNQAPAYDRLINAEVALQLDERMASGKVSKRAVGPDGRISGKYHEDPKLNSILYEVEFSDGQVREYTAKTIAESMLVQVDSEGVRTIMMEGIVDYQKNDAVAVQKQDQYVYNKNGRRRMRKTTMGWELLVKWRDQSESWVRLCELKESHPIETAEFAMARGIQDQPAFVWWVPFMLRKRDAIVYAIKTRVRKVTRKNGIEIPLDVEHAGRLDKSNGNDLWAKALAKEMYNVGVAFEILAAGQRAPKGWRLATGHLIWDIKMDFTQKARWVLDGHKTSTPEGTTFAGVVSRKSVQIIFVYAALNGIAIYAADIRNAYLQAPSSQRDYIICGLEFGLENVGHVALIHRALYGGKMAGKDFRNHLPSCMGHLGFKSCPANLDVWMRPAEKSDGSKYYEFVLLYVDDTLVVSENAERILRDEIGRYFKLKEESIGPLDIYLGGKVRKMTLDNGQEAWSFSSSQYVRTAVQNVEEYLNEHGNGWPERPKHLCGQHYCPELDVTPELESEWALYYQSLIGVLRWIVELGRVDIHLEVSMMSSHLAMPREGHLEQVLRIFSHLKKYHNTELVFDPSDPVIDESQFE